MRKIALFIENSSIHDVSLTSIDKGNPGIGGTEYLMFMLANMLTRSDNGIDVTVYIEKEQQLPPSIKYEVCGTLPNAIKNSEKSNCQYLVVKHNADYIINDELHCNQDLKLIVWCHVFICFWELDYYTSNSDVKWIVYVGREHLQLNIDHPSYKKSTYIYNFIDLEGCEEKVKSHPFAKRKPVVTYLGSLVPFKGFHLLAEAWPHVLKEVPEAELYVIGSGKVYDSHASLGKLGIACKEYEDVFSPYLIKDNKLIPSVHFLGRMGAEKEDILLKTKVGVPNPTGITETFCLSAVEMQILGARIATVKAPGYLDTVKDGILYKRPEQLTKSIISLLKDNVSNYEEAMRYFESQFSKNIILKQWENLLKDNYVPNRHKSNLNYRFKWMKAMVGYMCKFLPDFIKIPNIERVLVAFERKILHRYTFMDSNLKL